MPEDDLTEYERNLLVKLDQILAIVQELRQRQLEMEERLEGISQRSQEQHQVSHPL